MNSRSVLEAIGWLQYVRNQKEENAKIIKIFIEEAARQTSVSANGVPAEISVEIGK